MLDLLEKSALQAEVRSESGQRLATVADLPASAYLQKIVHRGCLIDVKSVFDPAPFRKKGLRVWRL